MVSSSLTCFLWNLIRKSYKISTKKGTTMISVDMSAVSQATLKISLENVGLKKGLLFFRD